MVAGSSGSTDGAATPARLIATMMTKRTNPPRGLVTAGIARSAQQTTGTIGPFGFTAASRKSLAPPVRGLVFAGIARGAQRTNGTIVPLGFGATGRHGFGIPIRGLTFAIVARGTQTTQGAIVPAFHLEFITAPHAVTVQQFFATSVNGKIGQDQFGTDKVEYIGTHGGFHSDTGNLAIHSLVAQIEQQVENVTHF